MKPKIGPGDNGSAGWTQFVKPQSKALLMPSDWWEAPIKQPASPSVPLLLQDKIEIYHRTIMRFLLLLLGLGFTMPALAQTGNPVIDSPAAYRQQGLLGPDHARLVQALLEYEVANISSLLKSSVHLQTANFTYTITNRATLAEVTGGTYTMTYYNALNKVLGISRGRFAGMAPGASRNQSVTFRRSPDTDHTEFIITSVEAE
jgi:hypothetical protein